jgi:signal transduction histidine kinase
MRRRLTIALVGVALASVLLVGAGVLVLAQFGARQQATEAAIERVDLLTDIAAIDFAVSPDNGRRRRPGSLPILQRVFPALGFDDAKLVVVEPGGAASTIDGFTVAESDSPTGRLSPLAQLDDDQLASLADGDAVLIDSGQLEDGALGRPAGEIDDRTVIVLQAIDSAPASTLAPAARPTVAVLGLQPVVTVGREARLWFLLSAAAVLGGALIVSSLLARRYSKPITQIERATAAVAAGDFSARVAVDGEDELAQLGRSVNEMAAELERSKALDQQFLMSVSHDLRTPLTAITGYGEALRDGAIGDPQVAGEVIGNQAARLERLVGDLLDLARLDANRFRLDLHVVDVAVVVGRTIAGLAPHAEQHGLTCRFENEGPAPALVDPDRLGQAVGNLVDNAIKYADSTITARASVDGGDALITVTDDGPGIATDDLPHVFERLYVAKHQPARVESSSGMGLAIVRELATAMGGSVAALPGEGSGTTLAVRLPLHRAVDPTIATAVG